VIEKFSAKKLSETGDVQYELDADKMTHFPVSDSAKFERVTFSATAPDKPSLEARAPLGSSLKGGDEVILDGGVVVNSSATKNSPAVVFTTPKLTILPDRQIARSVDGVVAESTMGTISASTFIFNNETRIAEFKRGKLVIDKARPVRNTNPNASANKP
jgi:lipopolysaccharide export system protein LptC